MLPSVNRYRINSPSIVAETIDGESIILNLESGIYYSAVGLGAEVWEGVASGVPVGEIARAVVSHHEGGAEMEEAVWRFLDEIVSEGLVDPLPAAGDSPSAWLPAGELPQSGNGLVLHRHSDMAHLLLLDPIHDVEEIRTGTALDPHG